MGFTEILFLTTSSTSCRLVPPGLGGASVRVLADFVFLVLFCVVLLLVLQEAWWFQFSLVAHTHHHLHLYLSPGVTVHQRWITVSRRVVFGILLRCTVCFLVFFLVCFSFFPWRKKIKASPGTFGMRLKTFHSGAACENFWTIELVLCFWKSNRSAFCSLITQIKGCFLLEKTSASGF